MKMALSENIPKELLDKLDPETVAQSRYQLWLMKHSTPDEMKSMQNSCEHKYVEYGGGAWHCLRCLDCFSINLVRANGEYDEADVTGYFI